MWFGSGRRGGLDDRRRRGCVDAERPFEFFCCTFFRPLLNLSLLNSPTSLASLVHDEGPFTPFQAQSDPFFAIWTKLLPLSGLSLVDRGIVLVPRTPVVRRIRVRRGIDESHRRHEESRGWVVVGKKEGLPHTPTLSLGPWSVHLWIGGYLRSAK